MPHDSQSTLNLSIALRYVLNFKFMLSTQQNMCEELSKILGYNIFYIDGTRLCKLLICIQHDKIKIRLTTVIASKVRATAGGATVGIQSSSWIQRRFSAELHAIYLVETNAGRALRVAATKAKSPL